MFFGSCLTCQITKPQLTGHFRAGLSTCHPGEALGVLVIPHRQVVLILGLDPWRDDAACASMGLERFFLRAGLNRAASEVQETLAICQSCPVQAECLEYALRHRITQGVWGGTLPSDRANLIEAVGDAAWDDGQEL